MIYFNNNTEQQRVSIPRSIASETAPTGPYRPGDGIYINDNTISVTGRQETLISGVNLKTLNGQSLLGQGDIVITPGSGSTYTPGTYIEITENNVINVTGLTPYTGVTEQEIVDALGAEPLTGITSGDVVTALGYVPASGESGPSLSAGTNISIIEDVISVTGITSYSGISKSDVTTALGFTPVSSTTITEIWSGTQAEYANIYPKLSTTLYLVHE